MLTKPPVSVPILVGALLVILSLGAGAVFVNRQVQVPAQDNASVLGEVSVAARATAPKTMEVEAVVTAPVGTAVQGVGVVLPDTEVNPADGSAGVVAKAETVLHAKIEMQESSKEVPAIKTLVATAPESQMSEAGPSAADNSLSQNEIAATDSLDKPSATIASDVGNSDTAEPASIDKASEVSPEAGAVAISTIVADATAPTFDLVRVDSEGAAVIAGTAMPGVEVQVTLGGKMYETVRADRSGAFVALIQLPQSADPLTLGLRELIGAKEFVVSAQTVLVVPPPVQDAPIAPTIVIADEEGAAVLQPSPSETPTQVASHPLALEAISYDQGGAVVLAGRGRGEQFVRVYVDNQVVQTEPVPDNGNWRVILPDIDKGIYTIRIDQINAAGTVLERVESPFKREAPADLLAAVSTSLTTSAVVVQPGHTLWALAKANYGDGVKYVQIFHANRDRIRNADLIYPGQVFDIPK
jgi:hypothetical protein